MAHGYLLKRGVYPCSTSPSPSASCCSASTSLMSVSPIDCEETSCDRRLSRPYMEFICAGTVSRVEFLRGFDPLSGNHESVQSPFPAFGCLPADARAPAGLGQRRTFADRPVGARGAERDRHHPCGAPCRGIGHQPCPAGLRHHLIGIEDGPDRSAHGPAPTSPARETTMHRASVRFRIHPCTRPRRHRSRPTGSPPCSTSS